MPTFELEFYPLFEDYRERLRRAETVVAYENAFCEHVHEASVAPNLYNRRKMQTTNPNLYLPFAILGHAQFYDINNP